MKSKERTIFGIFGLVAFFVVSALAFMYRDFLMVNRLQAWTVIVIDICLLFSALCIGLGGTMKNLVVGVVFLVLWTYGFLILPTPEGYGEAVYGGWALLAIIFVALYSEYEKFIKKKTLHTSAR